VGLQEVSGTEREH